MAARINRAEFNAAVRAPMLRLLHERLERAGAVAVERAERSIDNLYDNSRPAERRKGGVKLKGSMSFVMVDADPPTIALRSAAEHAALLNNGTAPHFIAGPVAFPRGDNPAASFYSREGVEHPGVAGSHFMEQAMEEALLNEFGTAGSRPRGLR